jgi:hypothetical protein
MNHEIERLVKEMQLRLDSVNRNNYKVIDETFGRDYLSIEIPLDIFNPDRFIEIGQELKRLHDQYVELRSEETKRGRESRRNADLANELFPEDFG